MAQSLSHIGEFGLIDWIRKRAANSSDVIYGVGDDTAVIKWTPQSHLLFTTDMLIEGTHFTKGMGPRNIGRKTLACSISDIAAMGGLPRWAVISLGVPRSLRTNFVKEIYQGIFRLAKEFQIGIVGGDTVKSQRIVLNIALLGEVNTKECVLRSGARPGDQIYVTGPLGGSLKSGRHLTFQPRVKESQFLVKGFQPQAMIDISDGLVADLGHICEKSSAGAILYSQKIPTHKGSTLQQALYDGEDFELLFILSKSQAQQVEQAKKLPFRFYRIGEMIEKRKGIQLINEKGQQEKLERRGFSHF